MKNKKIIIYTWNDISNAYSCLIYLKRKLEENVEVELWSLTKKDKLPNEPGFFSFREKKYWNIRFFRHFFVKYEIFQRMLKYPNDIYIINDLKFYKTAFLAKKKNNKIIVIHYNTEIPGKDVKIPFYVKSFYRNHSDFPDMIIECLRERAEWRAKEYQINKKIYVINNSLPADIIDNSNQFDMDEVENLSKGRKILLYAGRAGLSRNLIEIFKCIDSFKEEVFFLFLCYGEEKDFELLNEYEKNFSNCGNYMIIKSLPRKEVLKIMNKCDIGINYYDPNYSINHLYASPSKFFEYIACGINVISSNNIGINKMILDNDLGVCIKENESISDALRRLLNKGLRERDYIKNIFLSKYEYSIDSSEAVDKILNFLINC